MGKGVAWGRVWHGEGCGVGRRVWHGEEGVVIVVNGRRIHACCV